MKKILNLFYLASAIGVSLIACRPEPFEEVGDPVNNLAALSGNWRIVRVTQTDINAATKGFPFQQVDLTTIFPYTDYRVGFNLANGSPSTFTATPGNSPMLIPFNSGSWRVDDPKSPQMLTLISGTDTARLTLGSYPNAVNSGLKISLIRRDSATSNGIIRYDYEFAKQ